MEFMEFTTGRRTYTSLGPHDYAYYNNSDEPDNLSHVHVDLEGDNRSAEKAPAKLEQRQLMKVLLNSDKMMPMRERDEPLHVLRHLALCHTVIIDPKSLEYSASSPDEKALVLGAKKHGVEFVERNQTANQDFISIRYPNKTSEKFQVLDVLEFNSTRKRMSVILRNVDTK